MKTYNILLSFFLILMSDMGLSQSVPSYVPTNGLVGWWGFNGNAQDGSGNGNHLVNNGNVLYVVDRNSFSNSSIKISSNQQYLSNLNPNLPIGNSNRSLSVWYKQLNATDGATIFSQWDGVLHGTCNSSFSLQGSSSQLFFWGRCNDRVVTFPSDSNWINAVIVYDNSQIKFYKNGQLINNILNPNYYTFTTVLNTSGYELRIGHPGGNWQYPSYFNGFIDDVGFWNRALTPQEITNLYNSQLPTQTSLCLPTITTSSPSSVGVDTVVIGGDISNDGGSSIVLRGICYSTSPNPNMGNSRTEDGSGTGSFNTVLRGLTSSTTYYARSYAKNSNGVVVYGNEVSFTTTASLPGVRCPGTPTVTDIDGNIYNTVQIGNQCWTQSNLKTNRYRNGDVISNFFYYGNNPQNDAIFGKLYQHSSVTDFRGLCPTGWHVPSNGEWNTLINFLGGSSLAGGALKSTHIQPTIGGWSSPNTGATNSTGFTGLPGGYRNANGSYGSTLFNGGYWWTSTVTITNNSAAIKIMENINSSVRTVSTFISEHASIRCVVD